MRLCKIPENKKCRVDKWCMLLLAKEVDKHTWERLMRKFSVQK